MADAATFRSLELDGWSQRTDQYDTFTATLPGQCIEPLLDAAGVERGQDVLDLCCGTGAVAATALGRGASVTGVDFSPAMIEVAGKKSLPVWFAVGDAEGLSLPDATFHRALCNFGLFHLSEPDRAMAEACRVLRPGGRFAWTTWCGPDRSPWFRIVLGAVQRLGSMDVGLPLAPPAFRLADPVEAERAMRAAGFMDVTMGAIPAQLIWPLASISEFLDRATVRMTMLLRAQAAGARQGIDAAIVDELAAFATSGLEHAPTPAIVVAAASR